MPSKRTNDSVERILEELSHQQARDGVRDSVNERKVDEILKSVGIDTATPGASHDSLGPIGKEDLPQVEVSGGVAEDRFSTAVLDDLLGDLPSMKLLKKKSPRRAQEPSRQTQSAPVAAFRRPERTDAQPSAQTRTAPVRQTQPVQTAPVRQQTRPVQNATQPAATQTAPVQAAPARQTQSVPAPQPETRPQTRPVQASRQETPQPRQATPAREDTLGDTTRTSIIKNFLLKMAPGADHADTHALNEGKEQFQQFFGKTAAVLPDSDGKLRDPSRRKRGFFGLGKAEDTGEFVPINVSLGGRREEPAPQPEPEPEEEPYTEPAPQPEEAYYDADEVDDGEAAAPAYQAPAPQPEPEEPTVEKTVYHSHHAGAALPNHTATTGGITLSGIRAALRGSSSGATGTVYRKKRNTIEFTPGQKLARTPEPAPETQESHGEPVGEPVMTPTAEVTSTTAFNIPLEQEDTDQKEDTRDFLRDLGVVQDSAVKTAARAAQAAPRAQSVRPALAPQPEQTAPAEEEPPVQRQPVEQPPVSTAREDTFEEISRDEAATLTGEVRLADIAAGRTEEDTAAFASDLAHAGTHEVSPDTADFMAQLEAQPRPRPDTGAFVREIEQSINEEEPAESEDRFAKAASILTDTSEIEEPTAPRPKAKGGIRLTGAPEDETKDEKTEPPFEEEDTAPASRHKEYERLDDAPAVRRDLANRILLLTVAAIVSGASAALMLYLGIAAGGTLPMPAPLDTTAGATPLLATMLVLLVFCCALNWRTMLDGLVGLVKSPTADTLAALAALGGVVQLGAFLLQPDWYAPDKLCLLAGPAALVLCFNALGKRLDAITTRENFALVSAKVDHAVAYRLKDAGILRAVTRGLEQPHPNVLVSRPTQLMKDFLASSSSHRTSDKNQQQLGRLVGGVALAALVFTLLYRKDAGLAFTAMAAVLCLGAPLAGTLLSALPARLMQRSAAQVGAVIPGWRDIRQLGRVNVIQVTTQDLFPKGCVKLCGIKPVNKERIDLAIIYAASMMAGGAPTLREVFLGMIGDNRKLLNKVDDFETVYGMGYVGWINGERVLAGNRHLMEKFDIQVPSLEYEQRHTVNQRRVIYLAVSGKLFSMFQVAYQADPDTAAVLDGLRRTGMSLIVDCDDFNCDEALLEAAYTLPTGTVRVLDATARKALEPATAWLPESEGNMLHLGSFVSYVGGLEAAAGAAEGERKAAMILSVSVLLSCVLAVIMVLAGGIAALPLPALVLYQAAWAVLALIFPMLQRY
ncbi:hypothetical protein H6B15_05125 [Gemmiger formicilis]|uniref:hypothetical protein n=1 Tax=Gemmiger formicilis TaxID=745368 RepID=UPI00195D7A92|nr:hypothetical protein [Gemmiger formicilis]MBM6716037.1 hypothetical protein [Gemmiger formicilis]